MATPRTRQALKRVHVYYSGQVQGVGFRYAVEAVAVPLQLTGWVKNLRDGRVELTAEGAEQQLNQLLEQVRAGPMRNFITKVTVTWSEGQQEFRGFDVRYF